MRATGIIRRVDDLGRVVIPKEIRRALKIQENDPLEIYVEDDAVCFKSCRYKAIEDACQEVMDAVSEFVNPEQREAITVHLNAIRKLAES